MEEEEDAGQPRPFEVEYLLKDIIPSLLSIHGEPV
jgi:hypothetical protein